MIYCAFKCYRSQQCNAVSYNDLSKTCDFHGTVHSTIVIKTVTDKNQYLVIPKDMPTTTNFSEAVKFEETTEDKFLSTVQETAAEKIETTTIIPQQKNWTILGDVPEQSDKENKKENHETSDSDDETSESETGPDATQISVQTNNAVTCESASATECEDDNGQSQSIINPVADPQKRKKIN
ncbi:unnamed protein product [Mytilus coruscus]|uniref:Uncharacterized protein n=1 Tax=Mytilus coruscus TaxID=42192 RepID=A0A6J8A358_MYTCO|nr:unnamed protein product [Mytilus coruscus]